MKITEDFEQPDLNEIYQAIGMQFAFVRKTAEDEYSQTMPFILCRDFFSDALVARAFDVDFSMFGFETKGVTYDKDKARLLVKSPKLAITSLSALNSYEKAAGMEESTLTVAGDALYLIEGDAEWVSNTVLLSLYTMLLRLTVLGDFTKWDDFLDTVSDGDSAPDNEYCDTMKEEKFNLTTFLSKRDAIFTEGVVATAIDKEFKHKVHDYSGIMSLIEGKNGFNKAWSDTYKEVCNG